MIDGTAVEMILSIKMSFQVIYNLLFRVDTIKFQYLTIRSIEKKSYQFFLRLFMRHTKLKKKTIIGKTEMIDRKNEKSNAILKLQN